MLSCFYQVCGFFFPTSVSSYRNETENTKNLEKPFIIMFFFSLLNNATFILKGKKKSIHILKPLVIPEFS